MPTAEIVQALNQQMTDELYSSNLYLQMAAWCEAEGLDGASAFFRRHVAEEFAHRDRIVQYLFECDAEVTIGAVPAPRGEYESLLQVIEAAYEHEQKVTESINSLAEMALTSRDFNTFNVMQWFIAEQREEEVLFRGVLDQAKLAAFTGDTGQALFHLNAYMGKVAAGVAGAGPTTPNTI